MKKGNCQVARRVFFLVIFLFFVTNSPEIFAQDLINGSYRIEYGGIYKLMYNETNRILESRWRDAQDLDYLGDKISFGELVKRQRDISAHLTDWRDGPPWYTRRWWHSLEEHNGGAPPNKSIIVRRGTTTKMIQTPLFTVYNSFEFRWRKLSASIDFKAAQTITLSVDDDAPPIELGWKLEFSPQIKVSTVHVLAYDFSRTFSILGVNINAIHTVRGKKIVEVRLFVWYLAHRHDVFIGVSLRLIRW